MTSRKFRIRTYNNKVFWIEERNWFLWSCWGDCEGFSPGSIPYITPFTFKSIEAAEKHITDTLAKEAKEKNKKRTVKEFEILSY